MLASAFCLLSPEGERIYLSDEDSNYYSTGTPSML